MSQSASPHRTVMVVNSEPEFLRVIGLLLEEEGFRTVTMHMRDATFPIIRGLMPNLLVLDFAHGQSKAMDLLNELDRDQATRSIPLLATSTDEELLARVHTTAPERPLTRLLVKPVSLDDLLAAVQELCGNA